MDEQEIKDSELLYRVVKNSNPNCLIKGKLSAALFLDDNGVSVDRDGGRDEQAIINKFKDRFNRKKQDYKASAKITAKQCRDINTCPLPKANKNNPYHAEIWDSDTTPKIDIAKAMQLAKVAILIE
ncbi:TPA: hypothetical protein IAC10_04995 [Candidatus Scatousia excrementigallinarum]|uniref:Uncharacterized protein n=1 Tax=Candidatus Scatousia excrementigallinarum TaxID=2840935 RepID=A0A9D1EYB3_9BACT|nr:hypothetical protein [Candidatus Scatousia excrementigallinarum]